MKLSFTEDHLKKISDKIPSKYLSSHLRSEINKRYESSELCEPCEDAILVTKYYELNISPRVQSALRCEAALSGVCVSELVRRLFIEPLLLGK